MPVDKQVIERYRVLNECFRNPYRDYTIDDLVDECNKALRRLDKPGGLKAYYSERYSQHGNRLWHKVKRKTP